MTTEKVQTDRVQSEKDQIKIADLWGTLTGRQRLLTFHLGNVPMIHLGWSELDERQKQIVLNAGSICGLDGSRRPDPSTSRRPGSVA
jgi:hypothetical protein